MKGSGIKNGSPVRKGLSFLVEWLDQQAGSQEVRVRQEKIYCRKLPKEFDGYRLVQISDLHSRLFGAGQEQLLEAVQKQKPQGIFLTGDIMHRQYNPEEKSRIRPFIKGISQIAPVYAVEGNHESRTFSGRELLLDMKRQGITVLRNRGIWLRRGKEKIGIAGLCADETSALRKKEELDQVLLKEGEKAMQLFSPKDYVILLAHCPEKLKSYERMGASLVLSGHAHGGLMRLPGGRALLAPGQGWLPKYTWGLYTCKETVMEVSCGLGGPRIGIPPEIVCLELYRER